MAAGIARDQINKCGVSCWGSAPTAGCRMDLRIRVSIHVRISCESLYERGQQEFAQPVHGVRAPETVNCTVVGSWPVSPLCLMAWCAITWEIAHIYLTAHQTKRMPLGGNTWPAGTTVRQTVWQRHTSAVTGLMSDWPHRVAVVVGDAHIQGTRVRALGDLPRCAVHCIDKARSQLRAGDTS